MSFIVKYPPMQNNKPIYFQLNPEEVRIVVDASIALREKNGGVMSIPALLKKVGLEACRKVIKK